LDRGYSVTLSGVGGAFLPLSDPLGPPLLPVPMRVSGSTSRRSILPEGYPFPFLPSGLLPPLIGFWEIALFVSFLCGLTHFCYYSFPLLSKHDRFLPLNFSVIVHSDAGYVLPSCLMFPQVITTVSSGIELIATFFMLGLLYFGFFSVLFSTPLFLQGPGTLGFVSPYPRTFT